MTTEIKLKAHILSNYKSVREFCIENDFPYSTIDNMLKRERGIGGTSVSIVMKVCDCLEIDIDELAKGNIVEKAPAIAELTRKEKQLVSAYRDNPTMQSAVDVLLGLTE